MIMSVYKIIELVGTSDVSWQEAAKNAVETAAKHLTDLRIVEINKLDMHIEEGKVVSYRARINVSFKYGPTEALDLFTRIATGESIETEEWLEPMM